MYRYRPFKRFDARRVSTTITAIASATVAAPVFAETREDEQVWLQVNAQGSIKGDLVYFAELQPRFGDAAGGLAQLLIRPAVGVKLSKSVTVYQGYAHVRSPVAGRRDTHENRSFQQINWSLGRPGGVALSSRTRIEQRWLSTGDDMGWRVRQMVRAAKPVKQGSRVSFLGFVEGFVALNDTDWGARGGFDRVRSFAGLELPLSGKSTVEVGYLNQYVNGAARDQMDHVAAINLMLRQ